MNMAEILPLLIELESDLQAAMGVLASSDDEDAFIVYAILSDAENTLERCKEAATEVDA